MTASGRLSSLKRSGRIRPGCSRTIEALLGGERPAGIIVVTGPGSYAGLRVGIATAQGLSLATGAPLYGVRTFEAVALAAGAAAVTAIHPARSAASLELQRWAAREGRRATSC
ncbi:hypothetical protein O0235_10805 [Tepidiforma flava]|uniref:Gcp-like domain-containing protein n=1 Tax=Tepidiforma flava TaxID=3004094 RepID=A0ABY7M3V1_9CHLR|nr:hypothetical protein [Tepidiforma flava]WBL35272.1 hypothetical protein O0235_10805 [Tepidiforma flava]